jgi:DNA-binding response OmpR family regulator
MTTKVLIIDDDLAITDLMSMLLKTHGFDAIPCNSGAEGIKLARENTPQIILLDLMMPDMDGWQVCRALRSFTSTPILILSAINDPRMVASVLDLGADDFLVKPVPSGVLVAHLRKMVRRTGALGSPESHTDGGVGRNTAPLPSLN